MKLLIADDHTLFRDALYQYIMRSEPNSEVVLTKNLNEALSALEMGVGFDLVLLDLRMPGMNGMDGFRIVREKFPDTPLSLMSGIAEKEDVQKAIDLGAVGYFPKTLSGKALLKAIQLVLAGEKYIPIDHESSSIMPSYYAEDKKGNATSQNIYDELSTMPTRKVSDIKLTPRETDVLEHLVKGISNKEIANELDLQEVTIKLHVRGICRKLGVKNRTQAALKARELGLAS